MNILCRLGLHKWKYEESDQLDIRLFEYKFRHIQTRICLRCYKYQEDDVHCLGLNPPQYIIVWK